MRRFRVRSTTRSEADEDNKFQPHHRDEQRNVTRNWTSIRDDCSSLLFSVFTARHGYPFRDTCSCRRDYDIHRRREISADYSAREAVPFVSIFAAHRGPARRANTSSRLTRRDRIRAATCRGAQAASRPAMK